MNRVSLADSPEGRNSIRLFRIYENACDPLSNSYASVSTLPASVSDPENVA
jgi:hypothetical protein